jgi:2-keto-4-pentenoate hydratase/2-oxohepta-3-ene-1,7-dioic acid hydratase in catechol pathway
MRYVGVRRDGSLVPAVLDGSDAIPLAENETSLRILLGRLGPDGVRALAEEACASRRGAVDLAEARLGPPVADAEKVLCVGLNYRDHAAEVNLELPSVPVFFAKFACSLTGPADDLRVPTVAQSAVDYEAELALVIGTIAHEVSEEDALDHVAGAMCFNDVSARDLQFETSQWLYGKAIDAFAPAGPALVTLDELGDLATLGVRTALNGEIVQDGTTADMVFTPAQVISRLSRVMTLQPGDVIATGTPAGVGMSFDPPRYLRDGDRVEVEIDGIGRLSNMIRFA